MSDYRCVIRLERVDNMGDHGERLVIFEVTGEATLYEVSGEGTQRERAVARAQAYLESLRERGVLE